MSTAVADATTAFVVYAYLDADGKAVYIGQTQNLEVRRQQHSTDRRSDRWYDLAVAVEVLSTHTTRDEAKAAEREVIRQLSPVGNRHHVRRYL